jgi:hypothetical protein
MKNLRLNEFKDLLEMHELLFEESDYFIKADIPVIGNVTYYPKKNRLQINKGNIWKDNGFYFIKNHLNNQKK